jgi:hypothetical protein
MKISAPMAAVATTVIPGMIPSVAETMRLSQLKRADMVARQCGQSVPDAACAAEIISEIDAYGGAEAMREFTIDVEAYSMVIARRAGDFRHECRDGVHTLTENGRRSVLQKYDENGEPTMMER